MDQATPQADDVGPRGVVVLRPYVGGDPARGFSHDLRQTYQREGGLPIRLQVGSLPPKPAFRASARDNRRCSRLVVAHAART